VGKKVLGGWRVKEAVLLRKEAKVDRQKGVRKETSEGYLKNHICDEG